VVASLDCGDRTASVWQLALFASVRWRTRLNWSFDRTKLKAMADSKLHTVIQWIKIAAVML
jgi:hypothetical protein